MEAVIGMFLFILGVTSMNDSTEILLLDSNKTSSIVYKSSAETKILDKPNEYMNLSDFKGDSSKVLSSSEVNAKFGRLIDAAADSPVSYLLYFLDGDTLTDDSKALIAEIKQTIKNRAPCEVSIIGHTDTTGSQKLNQRVSLKRAEKVAQMFSDDEISRLDIYSFGESNLLIKTPDNVVEPRNRRVEIQIR